VKYLRGYVSSRLFMNERAPQHIQNIVLREYCYKIGYEYLLSGTEYAMNSSYLILEQLINEIPKVNGIIAYSLFQMPDNQKLRISIYNDIISNGGEIHFAVERLEIRNLSDIERLENIWSVRKTMEYCHTFGR
jgi:sporadic carbohydrate cluster protein (TIGR04323 family)